MKGIDSFFLTKEWNRESIPSWGDLPTPAVTLYIHPGGHPGVRPSQRLQDTKKYLRICENLDGGFVGENQVLMLFSSS